MTSKKKTTTKKPAKKKKEEAPVVKRPVGRPPVFNDPKQVEQLKKFMRLKPTIFDVVAFFKVSKTAIEDFLRREFKQTFSQFREEHMVETRMMLVRTALGKARGGDNTMLIFPTT